MPPKAGGAGGHFHRTFSEAFYVLDGAPSFWNGETWTTAGPGFYLHVPKAASRLPQRLRRTGVVPDPLRARRDARGLLPGPRGSAASGKTMTKAEFEALCERFDQTNVE